MGKKWTWRANPRRLFSTRYRKCVRAIKDWAPEHDPCECVHGPWPAVRHRTPVQNKAQIRDSGFKIGNPTHFLEKQSHQLIENKEERPIIGQNNPNFGHSPGGSSSKSRERDVRIQDRGIRHAFLVNKAVKLSEGLGSCRLSVQQGHYEMLASM
jgi:hypothetical protein